MIGRFFLLILPVLLFSSELELIKKANEAKLYQKKEWLALLHADEEKSAIYDSQFILSKPFSPKNELDTTLKAFFKQPKSYSNINEHPQCKFPARLLFITHELNITKDDFPKVVCEELKQYENKAPADTLSLVYASENVKNPSSMMGHTFLKYSGLNYQNDKVEHAISFYTIIESFNLLHLAYQNSHSGMKGFFALQPYRETIKQYIEKENRNVWEYKLRLSDYRKKLMYYHVWELKDKKMSYFFTSYNCSTVIYYILSLANPKIYDDKKLWITPLDTVKFLYKYDLIDNSELIASDEWLVKMLKENVTSDEVDTIKNIVENQNYEEIASLNFYSQKLLEAYATLQYKNSDLNANNYKEIEAKIKKDDKQIDISKYKSPNNIPPERQFGVGYARVNDENFAKVSFLGASHLLNDNNREYFGESELKIGYLSLLANSKKIELDEFTLYGMKLYIPYDTLTKDLSYQFEIAVKKEFSKKMDYIDTFKIDGGVGLDFSLANDINIFVLLNGGFGYNKDDKAHLFFNPQIGGMIYEVFNMKSLFYYQPLFIGKDKVYDKYLLNHNIFVSKNYKVFFNIEFFDNKKEYVNYEFGLSRLF